MHRFALALILATLPTAALAVPMEMSQQGRLLDSTGAALDGTISVEFSVWDAAATGAQLWTETQDVDFTNGYYSVRLGATTPFEDNDFDGTVRWLELTVDGGTPLPTRLPMVSVPYAMNANSADTATNVSGGIVDATEIRINGVAVIEDAGGTLGSLACADGQVALWNNTATVWECGTAGGAHTHNAADIDAGFIDMNRLQVGTSSGTLAEGNHGHGTLATTGELDAQGGVKLGGPTVCTASEEGTMRYVSGSGVSYCDGAGNWLPLDGGATTMFEKLHGTQGKTELYHFAMSVPGAALIGTSAFGGNAMMFCSVLTDDNENGGWGLPHDTSGTFENAYILGYANDINGHCLEGADPAWTGTGPCVSLLVSNWEETSHEGFGAWCRANTGADGSIVWAQINLDGLEYQNSAGTNGGAIAKPLNVGDVECVVGGQACVQRVQ